MNRTTPLFIPMLLVASGLAALGGDETAPRVEGAAFARLGGEAAHSRPLGRLELPGADLESKARAWLAGSADLVGVGGAVELELASVRRGKAVEVVRFRQVAFGLPVLRGGLAVSFDRAGRAIFVANDLKPLLGDLAALGREAAAASATSAAEARSLALAKIRPEGVLRFDETRRAIFPGEAGARVVWAQRLVASGGPFGDWELLVDAASGELLRLEDRSLYGDGPQDGQGQAYLPDPLASSGNVYGAPYADLGDADNDELRAEIFDVVLEDLVFENDVRNLKGPYADCQGLLESPNVDPDDRCRTLPGGLDFRLVPSSRESQRFEEMNVYYHLDRFMRYLNEELEFEVLPIQYVGGVRFDPHGLGGADNSHYISSTGIVAFGDGCVDDSEDADVVVHELGHGIHDWITDGNLSQVQGLSEGLGDYFAVSYSHAAYPATWDAADPQYYWVFKWDGHNECWNGRRANWNDDHLYDTSLVGLHTLGQFWASCNIDVAEAIGYPETDLVMLEGISMTGSSTNQAQAAAALMTAAEALGYSLEVRQTMANLYNDASGGFGCNYGVAAPDNTIFVADHEENDLLEWSSHVP